MNNRYVRSKRFIVLAKNIFLDCVQCIRELHDRAEREKNHFIPDFCSLFANVFTIIKYPLNLLRFAFYYVVAAIFNIPLINK